jgi:hypothetical protein
MKEPKYLSLAWYADHTPAANQPESKAIKITDLLLSDVKSITRIIEVDGELPRVAIPKRPRSMSPTRYFEFFATDPMIVILDYLTHTVRVKLAGPEQAGVYLASVSKQLQQPIRVTVCWEDALDSEAS